MQLNTFTMLPPLRIANFGTQEQDNKLAKQHTEALVEEAKKGPTGSASRVETNAQTGKTELNKRPITGDDIKD